MPEPVQRWSRFGRKPIVAAVGFLLLGYMVCVGWGKPVVVNGRLIMVEVAATPAARSRGLMHRESLPADRGMLFIFEAADYHTFWMKDTLLPLSIAFLDDDRRVIAIYEMRPRQTEERYAPTRPARYALEMNAGWFQRRNVGVGDRLFFW